MKWDIIKELGRHKIQAEEKKYYIAQKGKAFVGYDDKTEIIKVEGRGKETIMIKTQNEEIPVNLKLDHTDCLVRPPMAEQTEFVWHNKNVILKQMSDRSFELHVEHKKQGELGSLLNRKYEFKSTEQMEEEFALLINVLAIRMFHEDDIEIV